MNKLLKLSYDGKGINDTSQEYSPRVATFYNQAAANQFGDLFAAAPDLLNAAEMALKFIMAVRSDIGGSSECRELALAIGKAKGLKG